MSSYMYVYSTTNSSYSYLCVCAYVRWEIVARNRAFIIVSIFIEIKKKVHNSSGEFITSMCIQMKLPMQFSLLTTKVHAGR